MAAVESFIGMGSNLGDGPTILNAAWNRLGEYQGIQLIAMSRFYKTAPVDMTSAHWFTNSVGKIQTDLSPSALLKTLLAIETSFGRTRNTESVDYQDRPLDLDMLYYGDIIINTPELILPHPRVRERLFVLVPLMELAPDHRDPLSGETVCSMEQQLNSKIANNSCKPQVIFLKNSED